MASHDQPTDLLNRTRPHDQKRTTTATCPRCSWRFDVSSLKGRRTNYGNENCRALVHFLNTETRYEANSEPVATQRRGSGVGIRPDIKVRRKDSLPGVPYIYVERQEQNSDGTGAEKVANKIHKALQVLRDVKVDVFYIVLAGTHIHLLLRVANDTFDNGGAYRHERLKVMSEDDFRRLAVAGNL
jgi:hypothetical protein